MPRTAHNPTESRLSCLAVLGPTCSWKSDVAFRLARRLDAEIISCDSMQVYRGMDIGTAKPPADWRRSVPHHLIDSLSIHEPYDANRFVSEATAVLDRLAAEGRMAVLVGGTGLYARVLVYGLTLLPADKTVFAQILEEYALPLGREQLQAEILGADADTPREVLANPRRLQRAVEVLRLTGSPPPQHAGDHVHPLPGFRQVIILPEPELQRLSIGKRAQAMLEAGWVEETRDLLRQGLLRTPTARQALGYREIARHIGGEFQGEGDLLTALTTKTVQYARRQRTWFRNQHPGAEFLPVNAFPGCPELGNRVAMAAGLDVRLR